MRPRDVLVESHAVAGSVAEQDVAVPDRGLAECISTSAQIDISTWAEKIEVDYGSWCKEQ